MSPSKRTVAPGDDEKPPQTIHLVRLQDAETEIAIVGQAPVIPHKWSEKSLRLMREAQTSEAGTVRAKREAKNPEEEAEQSCYWLPDGRPGILATAFKAAIADASRHYDGVTKVQLKQLIYVIGEGPDVLVPIDGKQEFREDTPRNSGGSPDLRYRYQFSDWRATLRIRFVPNLLPLQSVIALVDAAGRGGVGDWRPSSPRSSTGVYGTWRVDDEAMA
jgi:hypothetical protein